MRLCLVAAMALSGSLAGCISLYPVETTPEGILGSVGPGDTVRMTTRDRGELTMRVWSVSDEDIRGHVEGDSEDVVRVRFDRIQTIEVERLSLKKAMLTTFLPAVIAAVIVCNNRDCETRSGVTAAY